MHTQRPELRIETLQDPNLVSARFLSELFCTCESQGFSAPKLVGDLPISLGEGGGVIAAVEWNVFCDFMRRLGHEVGGARGLERCGETLGQLAPARVLNSLAGIAASPHTLYQAASGWVLRREIPGIEAQITKIDDGHFEIEARIAEGLRECPEIFYFMAGVARVLPQAIGLKNAVVSCLVEPNVARYKIAAPPSLTILARAKRIFRTIFSAGSVLNYLEDQRLELHAKNDALQSANAALEESERRYRAITDTAVDVLCEVDATGRILYVSASVGDLIGYSPEQVTGSHYRLWIPGEWHDRVEKAYEFLVSLPPGRATQELVKLHAYEGPPVLAELTARSYDTHLGERRVVVIIRDQNDRKNTKGTKRATTIEAPHETTTEMAHIVERVMIGHTVSLDEAPQPQWLETQKLLRDVRDSFRDLTHGSKRDRAGANGILRDVEIVSNSAPGEIFANEELLTSALAGLLDWAAARAAESPLDLELPRQAVLAIRVRLCVKALLQSDGQPSMHSELQSEASASIVFEVDAGIATDMDLDPAMDSPASQLAFKVAADAVRGMDGRLSGEAGKRRITLPQPTRPTSSR